MCIRGYQCSRRTDCFKVYCLCGSHFLGIVNFHNSITLKLIRNIISVIFAVVYPYNNTGAQFRREAARARMKNNSLVGVGFVSSNAQVLVAIGATS